MTTKNQLAADAAYENAVLTARDLLGRIDELILDMPAPGGDTPINWADVGSAVEVSGRLANVVAFLEGRDYD